jgi:hypothetical protein
MNQKVKTGRNDKCPCGSGLKFKKCCLFIKEQQRQLTPFARIISKDGSEGEFKVLKMRTIQNGVEKIHQQNEITLSTNQINGDKGEGIAQISYPNSYNNLGKIETSGNAKVSNSETLYKIKLQNNSRKLAFYGEKLYCKIHIKIEKDLNLEVFHFYFGKSGEVEKQNEKGEKDRPHISITPDGSGRFIRMGKYKCEFSQINKFNSESNLIYPEKIQIKVDGFNEYLEVFFEFNIEEKIVTLMNLEFKSN